MESSARTMQLLFAVILYAEFGTSKKRKELSFSPSGIFKRRLVKFQQIFIFFI